jgi:hypothetical protein
MEVEMYDYRYVSLFLKAKKTLRDSRGIALFYF